MGRNFKIVAWPLIIVVGALTLWLIYGKYRFHQEMARFRKTVKNKKILSTSRERCRTGSPNLETYNKCLQTKMDAAVDQHAAQLYASFNKICRHWPNTTKFPYCVQDGLHKVAWDTKDLVLKLIAIRVIEKVKDPPGELKDDAAKYYGDAMKIWNKKRLISITPLCPCKSKPPEKPAK